jgi:RNA polymerase sigma-70 factor (ECF subfamily)
MPLKLWRRTTPVPSEHPKTDGPTPAESKAERTERVERLFREHNEALLRFLQARVGSYQEAREVAQEAYVRLLSLDRQDAVSYLRAFLFKTAANIAIDRRRRDHTYDRVRELPLFGEFADTLTPERRVAGEEQLALLERSIAMMPPKCQQSFVMSQIYGMDAACIAIELGLSASQVRRYVARALLHCRAQLDVKESWDD